MTRLSTLLKYSDSMLAAMFSGRHQVDKDKDGNYFLDSNGQVFGQILEFLRNGSLPTKENTYLVYRDANYYGLHELVDKLSLRPEIAAIAVKEAQRAQFPNYAEIRDLVIRTAIANASINRVGEVNIYAFRKEFVAKSVNFNAKHQCVTDQAHVIVGPWDSAADEETYIRCLETDLTEEGYNVKPHEAKRKCRYYNGQTCQKFIFRVTIMFDWKRTWGSDGTTQTGVLSWLSLSLRLPLSLRMCHTCTSQPEASRIRFDQFCSVVRSCYMPFHSFFCEDQLLSQPDTVCGCLS